MTVILRTLEILALLGVLGLPVNLLLLTRIDRPPGRWRVSARLLLAPVTGLAVFTVFTGFFYATARPIVASIPWFWWLLGGLWLAALLAWWRSAPRRFPFRPGWRSALSHGLVAVGLVVVLEINFRPFVQDPDRVFWHYAGSDGYMYMRMAENIGSRGTGIVPTLGPFDGVSGFLTEDLRHLHDGWFTEKPGTMAALAGMAGLLGLTTHETFSPLLIAGLALLYLTLVVFGRSLLRLPLWAGTGFAIMGTLAMPVWMLSSHTFFANVLALPFYPLVMLAVRPVTTWRSAVYVGLVLAAQTLLFPDGELALVGVLAVVTPFLLWTAWRRRRLLQLLGTGALTVVTTLVLVAPFGRVLFATTFARLLAVLSAAPRSALQGSGEVHLHFLSKTDYVWPALNLNMIPPQPLLAGEKPYLLGFAALLVLFIGASLLRRPWPRLLPYLLSFLLILGFGLLGGFQSDYELFRALAIFAFVPLAAVCVLPWLVAGHAHTKRATILRLVLLALIAPLLVHFVRNDLKQFQFAYDDHFSDAQYTTASLKDRTEISRLGASHSMVLATETPTFTAMANAMVLLSPVKLGLPKFYQKFVFFNDVGNRDVVYEADLVVRNLRYIDIFDRTESVPAKPKLYVSGDFEVVENDREPFFDTDTFPMWHGYPKDFMKKRGLPLSRILSQQTVIKFFSRATQPIIVELQFAPGDLPASLPVAFDHDPAQHIGLTEDGRAILPLQLIGPGLHTLTLGPLPSPAQVSSFHLHANGTGLAPALLKGGWFESKNLKPDQLTPFQYMNPHPSRFYSTFGLSLDKVSFGAHPVTRLCFPVRAGHRRLQTTVQMSPGAYENLAKNDATDGINIEVALLTPTGGRSVVFTREIDPAHVATDRGPLLVDVSFDVPADTEVELFIGPGKNGRDTRDWTSLSALTIN